jgi:hypothetical protein
MMFPRRINKGIDIKVKPFTESVARVPIVKAPCRVTKNRIGIAHAMNAT